MTLDFETEIFISYALGDDNEKEESREGIVNEVEAALKDKKFKVIRDKKDLKYRGRIKEFMQRIGGVKIVVAVISDKFLRSDNCMYEMAELMDNYRETGYAQRLFPIVLKDADIYQEEKRSQYFKYWKERYDELKRTILQLDDATDETRNLRKSLLQFESIRRVFDDFTECLKDTLTLSVKFHRENNFEELIQSIEDQVSTDLQNLKEGYLKSKIFPSLKTLNYQKQIGLYDTHTGKYNLGAFLIRGNSDKEQKWLYSLLLDVGGIKVRSKPIKFSLESPISGSYLNKLLVDLRRKLDDKMSPTDTEKDAKLIVEKLCERLNSEHVVITLENCNHFLKSEDFEKFINYFWIPLTKLLGDKKHPHKLLIFIFARTEVPCPATHFLDSAMYEGCVEDVQDKLVDLEAADPLSEPELKTWLVIHREYFQKQTIYTNTEARKCFLQECNNMPFFVLNNLCEKLNFSFDQYDDIWMKQ